MPIFTHSCFYITVIHSEWGTKEEGPEDIKDVEVAVVASITERSRCGSRRPALPSVIVVKFVHRKLDGCTAPPSQVLRYNTGSADRAFFSRQITIIHGQTPMGRH